MTLGTMIQVQKDNRVTIPKEIVQRYATKKSWIVIIEREGSIEIVPVPRIKARSFK